MPVFFIYLLKLSVSLAVVFLFYQLILRKLTFYNSNRWYLLGYTITSFFIPFIDISPVLHKNAWNEMNIVQWVPVINESAIAIEGKTTSFNYWFIGGLVIIAGMAFLLCRLLVQFISFRKMRKNAEYISGEEMKVYQVNDTIIPFSFGNSIFINRHLHSEDELKEIIRHEFIHVKQRHSFDIIWAEILCLINWYNPFAWLLRKCIRQNLEFIADNKVLENGISKKEYQYLLLKVTGNNQYSIATQFNFSSLKKRITMMNKLKSTKRQMLRLLFLLPATAVLLLAFRNNQKNDQQPVFKWNGQEKSPEEMLYQLTDTVPEVTEPNSKGYIINIKDKSGECEIVIKDKNGKEVKRLLLTEWNKNPEQYEEKYGEIPPPPPSPPVPTTEQWIKAAHPNLKSLSVNNNLATVTLNNGKKESYDLNNAEQKNVFENKYGKLQPPPPPPTPVRAVNSRPPAPATPPTPAAPIRNNNNDNNLNNIINRNINNASDNFEITDKKAVIHLRNGKTEEYNLTSAEEKRNFESKYGKIINLSEAVPLEHAAVTKVSPIGVWSDPKTIVPVTNTVVVSPTIKNSVSAETITPVNVIVDPSVAVEAVTAVTVDILITITKNTTPAELNELVKQMKEKGYELKFDDKNYNNGVLTHISGTLKYKDSKSTFSVTDFKKLQLAAIIDDGKVYFNVRTDDGKIRI